MNMNTTGMIATTTDGLMASMTMTMGGAAATTTAAAMDMGGGGKCKISMLWNWYTIDSCFIASSWRITSSSVFAGSCVGVILLVMLLEFLRRSVNEYDAYLTRKAVAATEDASVARVLEGPDKGERTAPQSVQQTYITSRPGYRPNILEQAIRALLHTAQFAVAYFVMLLAMYYNGYIIICIFIGAFLGAFVFSWQHLGGKTPSSSASHEATVCCG